MLFSWNAAAIVCGLVCFAAITCAQQLPEIEPTPIPIPTAPEPRPTFSEPELPSQSEVQVVTSGLNPVNENVRRFRYSFGVTVREVYDDNINISHSQRVSDFYTAIEPGIHLGFGDVGSDSFNSLGFDYIASIYLFAKTSSRNAVEHLIRLSGQHRFGKLSVGLSEDVRILDGTSINNLSNTTGVQANTDAGGSAAVNTYTSNLSASYDLSGKSYLSSNASYSVSDYQDNNLISSQSINSNLFFNYVYSPKLTLGAGVTLGYTTSDQANSGETFEQLNLRINYIPGGKLSLSASGGVEVRQFGTGRGNYFAPVYELAVMYQPFDGTNIMLSGSGRTNTSASTAGQDYGSYTINLNVMQRFFHRIYLSVNLGYSKSSYFSTINDVSGTRADNYFYFEPAVDLNITRFWTFGFYYLYREDASDLAQFSFYDNQIGLRSTLTF